MPWCPKCKSEYREGITECADCKVPLVDELPPDSENPYSEEAQMKELQQWIIEPTTETALEENTADAEPDSEETTTDLDSKIRSARMSAAASHGRVYQDKKAKAEDYKSSAYTLIIIGVLGLIAIALIELGVLPISLAAPGKYITYFVMGFMFLVFIIMGVSSFKSSKKYAVEAKSEDDLTGEIKSWTLENVTKDGIIKKAALPADMPEEVKYFRYFDMLKNTILAQFGEMNGSYLESLCEELYSEIFEEN